MDRPRGVSLLEVLFAILVLSIGILALSGAMAYGLRGGKQGARSTEATGYARRLVDEVRSRNLPFVAPINDAAADRVPLSNAPFGGASGMPANTAMTRNISMNLLKAAKTGDATDYRNDLAQVVVRVYWFDEHTEKHVEPRALHRRQ